jgi:hypothetical protein
MILAHTKCFNHHQREAVARCTECGRYFCRECVAEHDDRLICAFCLKALAKGETSSGRLKFVLRLVPALVGIAVIWMFFYLLGKGLLLVPPSYDPTHKKQPQPTGTTASIFHSAID